MRCSDLVVGVTDHVCVRVLLIEEGSSIFVELGISETNIYDKRELTFYIFRIQNDDLFVSKVFMIKVLYFRLYKSYDT